MQAGTGAVFSTPPFLTMCQGSYGVLSELMLATSSVNRVFVPLGNTCYKLCEKTKPELWLDKLVMFH